MAMQTATSKLGQRYGPALDQAVLAHKDDPIDTGFSRLPGGIMAGIARLMECGFQEHKPDSKAKKADGSLAHSTGEMFFHAVGVVQEPKSVETPQGTVVTKGGQTRVFVPMYDTKTNAGKVTTQSEAVFEVLNHFKLLAGGENGGQAFVDQFLAAYPNPGDALEAMAAALLAAKPYFKFKTESGQVQTTGPYAGKPPMVFENWLGAVDYTPPGVGPSRDASGPPQTAATHLNGQQAAQHPTAPTGGTNRVAQAAPQERTDTAVDEMLKLANGDHTDAKTVAAQAQIRAWALAAGVPEGDTGVPNTVDGANDWEEVVKLMRAAEEARKPGSTAAAEETVGVVEEPAAAWQKGQMCQITVGYTDKATKQKKTRKVHCEVQAANPDGTCDLLNMDDRKTVYPKVKPELMEQVVS